MPSKVLLVTGIAAFAFFATFIFGSRLHPLRPLMRDERSSISLGAGMCAAYVFIHVMPEVHAARSAFAASASTPLRYEGMAIYYLALVGFLMFYGLDHLRARARLQEGVSTGEFDSAFKLNLAGFAAYVCLMSYLLVHNLEGDPKAIGLYAIAITFHFLALDHSLNEEHGEAYQRIGRYVLAGMVALGWGGGLLFDLPRSVLALMVAFISGAIIVNSLIMELPSDKDGRFLPFFIGGTVYGLILLPLG